MTVRWEARSHTQIYREVHTPTGDLASTVGAWHLTAADLNELRTRYESAFARLRAVSEGEAAEAAARASRRATRVLAEAQALATQAAAQRAKLTDLNTDLRRALPPPTPTAEETHGFLGEGTAWLAAPNFPAADADRLNKEEIARDRMRAYEEAIDPDTLTGDWNPHAAAATHDHPTRPLIPRPQFPAALLPQEATPNRVAGSGGTASSTTAHATGWATPAPPVFAAPHFAVPHVTAAGAAPPTVPFGTLDFGPRGHVEPEREAPPPVVGTPPRRRDQGEAPTPLRHAPDSPFEPGFRVSPSVLGEA